MKEYTKLYINGTWVSPHATNTVNIVNPSTEEVFATVVMGDEEDVDLAVKAARQEEVITIAKTTKRLSCLTPSTAVLKINILTSSQTWLKPMGVILMIMFSSDAADGTTSLTDKN